jgi:ABC-2 type transport system permease protein
MKQALAITRKELKAYFGSPMALIFVGAFLAATLFSFFWVDTFFARGIADARPLFRRMPVLLIFLVSALTMRQWSEEQRSGTLEMLLTLPIARLHLVLGKFLAVMALVGIALGLTFTMPLTVALLGNLDWGPVVGGYLAAILLASAYAAIGLFISSRTDNQIVALISSVLVCGLFYLAGSAGVTSFFGETVGGVLRAIGSGSRFESVERGVIDLRDLMYYVTLTALFGTLNVYTLARRAWGQGEQRRGAQRATILTTSLLAANLVLMNVWLYPLRGLRLDLTQQREYSLSRTTRELLGQLQEPLLIRGYFSERTHPLLAPLAPRIADMLQEYRLASGGKVLLELVDPAKEPDKEAEANQSYGIRPTPFQVAGRYETAIINSYFDILIRYGDQSQVLGFDDLIEIEMRRDGQPDVRLRNLEYDLTSAIKKTVYGFQSVDTILASLAEGATLTAYITPQTLPADLAAAPTALDKVAAELGHNTGKLIYQRVDPDAPGSPVTRQQLYDRYRLQPYAASLFSPETYYFHMVLQVGDQAQVIYPTGDLGEADLRLSIEAALRRGAPGFLQVVGLWTPPDTASAMGQQSITSWQQLNDALRQEYEVRTVELDSGAVPADVDVLLVVAPENLSERARYAVDQYLMRGGAVIVAAGNYAITVNPYVGGLALRPLVGGLRDWLAGYGIDVQQALVMDPQNEAFPVPVARQVGNITVQEIQALNYPFFVDVRSGGMASGNALVSNLPAVTLQWASPIVVDEAANAGRTVTPILSSSAQAWQTTDTNIQPNFDLYPGQGFVAGTDLGSHTLAVAVQGRFESAFEGQAMPAAEEAAQGAGAQGAPAAPTVNTGTIEASPESARLVVIGSSEFLNDTVLQISSQMSRDRYLNNLKLAQNAVAWSTEDLDLLTIRARGTSSRLLRTMAEQEQSLWEGANYVLALLALLALWVTWRSRQRDQAPMPLMTPDEIAAARRAQGEEGAAS